MGSHWQPPVKPFVEQRPINKPGSLSQSKSAISDLASYLPGMRGTPGIPKIFHQVPPAPASPVVGGLSEDADCLPPLQEVGTCRCNRPAVWGAQEGGVCSTIGW